MSLKSCLSAPDFEEEDQFNLYKRSENEVFDTSD